MSNVTFVPGASPKKLPFVHSNFKPSFKFAKTFRGCSTLSKMKHANEIPAERGKLPRLVFNVQDKRTTITFDSVRRGTRREYPGFVGQPKVLRQKHGRSENKLGDSTLRESTTGVHGVSRHQTKLRQKTSDNALGTSANSNSDTNAVQDSDYMTSVPELESLFIYDDNDSEVDHHLQDSATDHKIQQTRTHFDLGLRSTVDTIDETAILKTDPFARNVGKKLKEARGKSGMKRGKRIGKLKDRHALGDVITDERLQELLSARVILPPLRFSQY